MSSLEERFLQACKVGDIEAVRLAISLNVDVNCQQGWALRRAVRYNHPQIWDSLLLHGSIQVNLQNQYGLTALHTACRFNVPSAVTDLLRHPCISVNEKTVLGSTPLMVATKYARKQALEVLIRDKRVDLDTVDSLNRVLEEAIGAALETLAEQDIALIDQIIQEERKRRKEEEGRRNSLEEELIIVDGQHRNKVFDKIKELVDELCELHKREIQKLQTSQEQDSQLFQARLDRELQKFFMKQDQERLHFLEKCTAEKEAFNYRQRVELTRLLKKQEEETLFLQGASCRSVESEVNFSAFCPSSLGPPQPVFRKPIMMTGPDSRPPLSQAGTGTSGSVASVSPWDPSTPDEGYLTSNKETELPDMISSARRELECPVCMEVMAPPNRIWQCKSGHVICETCKERVKTEPGSQNACPTCKTAPFIGRNLALERVSRSLFALH